MPAWILRPTLWFTTAYTLVIVVHEAAHAVTAVGLGMPATLFNFWVDYDLAGATVPERAAVGIAGPTSGLVLGLVGLAIYRRHRSSPAGLPLVYLAAFGLSNFFGNLMSAAFLGDFSNAAVMLGLSPAARTVASICGAVSVAAISFFAGRELRSWVPPGVSRTAGVTGIVAVPVLIGTAVIVAINQPTPFGAAFVSARAGEGAFWLFAIVGGWLVRSAPPDRAPLRLRWLDGMAALLAFVAVRAMARGIPMVP